MPRPEPAPTLVHLVRHGLVDNPRRLVYGRTAGWHLSPEGRRQAEEVARRLAGRSIAGVYSSPLERAQETAAIVAAGAPVTVRDDLTEAALAAPWEGLPWSHVKAAHGAHFETYLHRPHELAGVPEPVAALADRMRRAVGALAAAHPGAEVVAVSHGDPIKAGTLALTGGDLADLSRLYLPPGGMITLRVHPQRTIVADRWTPRG